MLWLAAGCMTGPQIGEAAQALGEPNGDYPNYDERVVLYATNRARVDPTKEGWSSYPAQPPLQWSYDLNESARAHSVDMRDNNCFQHNSCDGTDVFTRINSYYTGQFSSEGENISAGVPDGVTAVHNWLYEIGAPAGETGHRDNIFSKDYTLMGVGFAAGGTDYTNYWTQDFIGNNVTRPALTDGIHFPVTAKTGAKLTYGVTWYDSGGAPPDKVSVVVDGKCNALTLTRGGDGMAAYEATLSFADGCHPYYFLASKGGKSSVYPDSGSLQAGYGSSGASCTLFQSSQAPSDCGGGGTTSGGGKGDMAVADAFMVHHPGGGDDGQPDMAQRKSGFDGGIIGPGSSTGTTGTARRAGGGCSAGGDGSSTALPLLLVAFWGFFRRRSIMRG
jgi:uncharacterized protein (TIGR03382 family)